MTILGTDNKLRCFGGSLGKELYGEYHDHDWAIACFDDHLLFIKLILECMQSGLSFEIILKRKQNYLDLFFNLDPYRCAALTDEEIDEASKNDKIIKHLGKIKAIKKNAQIFLKIAKEHGSFSNFLWSFVENTPIINSYESLKQALPNSISLKLSKQLKKEGMSFVGPVTIYSFMQSAGLINDHIKTCHLYKPQKN